MKRYLFLMLSFVPLFLTMSCNGDFEPCVNAEANELSNSFDKAKHAIYAMGLDTVGICEFEGYYVVENDILINKIELLNKSLTRQYHTTNEVSNNQVITVGVDNTITTASGWIAAIREVLNIYNQYTGLHLIYVESVNPTIRISKKPIGTIFTCAQGEFPTKVGMPGAQIYINTQFWKDIDSFLSAEEKIFLIMHELGHNLGLRHTDCAVKGEGTGSYGMIKIPGTPDVDSNSFMNSSTCGYSWQGMPAYDKVALEYLFPNTPYNAIHFEGCNLDDIFYYKGDDFLLDRTVVPFRNGYVFVGWHNDKNIYSPYNYETSKIVGNKVLYARWTAGSVSLAASAHSYAGNSSLYEVKSSGAVKITVRVYKGENTWAEIRNYNDTYFGIWGNKLTNYINMKPLMDVSEEVPYVERVLWMFLDKGTYQIQSCFTQGLGSQRNENDKHGYVYTTIEAL